MAGLDEDLFESRMYGNYTETGEMLISKGAKHLVYMNLPLPDDVLNPLTRQCASTIRRVQDANKKAAEELQRQHSTVQVSLVDAEGIGKEIAEEYRKAGKKLSEPCITAVSVINGLLEFYFSFKMGYDGCDHPENHWMWDEIHPSADVHQRLARGMVPVLQGNYYSPSQKKNETVTAFARVINKVKSAVSREEL